MSNPKPSSNSDNSSLPPAAFDDKPSTTKSTRTPLKEVQNILNTAGAATITFSDEKRTQENDIFSNFSIDEFSSQLELKDRTFFSEFIDHDPNLYGSKAFTDQMRSMSSLSPRYLKEKNNDWNRFLVAVSLHPKLKILSKLVQDPQKSTQKAPYLVILCRNGYTRPKYNILNACFIAFSLTLKKKVSKILILGTKSLRRITLRLFISPSPSM